MKDNQKWTAEQVVSWLENRASEYLETGQAKEGTQGAITPAEAKAKAEELTYAANLVREHLVK